MANEGGTAPLTYAALPWRVFREGLYDVFKQQASAVESRISQLFTVAKSGREWEELLTAAGIGAMPRWDSDGGEIAYTAPMTRYLTTITALDYAYGVEYTHKMKRALMYPKVLQAAKDLAISAQYAREVLAANIFNRAFSASYTQADGVALCSASHPLATGAAATTDSNLATGDLALSTLEAAITMLETTVDDMGVPMGMKSEMLLVHPSNLWTATQLLRSPDDPSTANRGINPIFNRGIRIVTWDFLTDEDAWFLLGGRRWLYWFDREPLSQRMEEDKRKTLSTYHNAAFAANCGIGDWRGVVGSAGA